LAYQVLARKWRPQRFADVVGQDHVTTTLANAIRAGRLAHGFLFCGPRGVGKTTTARILAKCLNCETANDGPVPEPCNECSRCQEIGEGRSLDVLEIDGASNRGIDEIRDLRENVRYAPSGGRAKVYIIDEVHMLTKEAFNALLKTLEEPPPGVYFVFATTEVHKVPATIRSRCQRYDFHRISTERIQETLENLVQNENFEAEPMALQELARCAEGGLRDAQSLLDQAAAVGDGKITLEGVRSLLGEAAEEATLAIIEAATSGNTGDAFVRLQELLDRGLDPARVATSLAQTYRDLLVSRSSGDGGSALGVRADLVEEYRRIAGALSVAKLTALLTLAGRTVSDLRRSARPRLTLEIALARMSRLEDPGEIESLVSRLEELRRVLGDGDGSGPPATRPPSPPRGSPAGTSPAGRSPAAPRSAGPPEGKGAPSPPARRRPTGSDSARASAETPPPAAAPVRAAAPSADAPASTAAPTRVRRAAPVGPPDDLPPPPTEEPPEFAHAATDAAAPTRRTDPRPAAAASASGVPAELEDLWKRMILRVARRKPMLGSFLEHGAPLSLEADALVAVFENNYYEGMVGRRENLLVIQEELSAAADRPLLLRAKVGVLPSGSGSSGAGPSSGSGEDDPAPERPQSMDLLEANPGLKRVIHDLGGQLLPGGS
jgi:DNA polymerase-3 subunit gamma/tau